MAYDPNSDRISMPMESLFDLLKDAAAEGMRIGKEGTAGDHTASGIGYTVFREYMRNRKPSGPVTRVAITPHIIPPTFPIESLREDPQS